MADKLLEIFRKDHHGGITMITMTRDQKQHYDELMASGDIEALREYLRVLEEKQNQKSEEAEDD